MKDTVPVLSATSASLSHMSLTATLDRSQLRLQSRRTMLAISYVIEDQAARFPGTTLIAAFQRLSFVMPQVARYRRIAPQLAHVYLIGVPDADVPALPNTTFVPIEPAWPLMHEWVVIANGPSCCAALLARDEETLQPGKRSHTFNGMWTSQPMVVDAAVGALFSALDQQYTPPARNSREILSSTNIIQQAIRKRL
ncbi:MAG TPA: DICT sensory domain-containing protein [Roseiflexaceae bacterium]|nr:DICT sensory domain-containing protein [Roseiflexaceae bacterium]